MRCSTLFFCCCSTENAYLCSEIQVELGTIVFIDGKTFTYSFDLKCI